MKGKEQEGTEMMDTILAVPCDQIPVITRERAEEILEQVRNRPAKTREEREALAERVRAKFGKPGVIKKHDRLLH